MAKAFVGSNPTLRTIMQVLVLVVYLERLEGRKSKALRDMINDPMIIKLKNGKVYGGRLDDYLPGGGVALYYCKLLDKKSHKWVDHDKMIKVEGKIIRDLMPYFWIADMKDIFVLPEEYRDKLGLDDTLQIYIDPHHKPFKGVQCNWGPGEKHAPECDGRLHEALSVLRTEASLGPENRDKDRQRRLEESFAYVRRRLLMYGAKIP